MNGNTNGSRWRFIVWDNDRECMVWASRYSFKSEIEALEAGAQYLSSRAA